MAQLALSEGLGPTMSTEATKDGHTETLTEVLASAYKSIASTSQRKLVFRCSGSTDELVNFDTFAFNSRFIRSITLSLQNVVHLNSPDPCPVFLLPETSPGIIKKVEAILQTGTCIIRDRKEALEVLEVANTLGFPISVLIPENESGVDTSSPIIFASDRIKTEIQPLEPEDISQLQPSPSVSAVTAIATSSNNNVTHEIPSEEAHSMVKGYKCAICKKPGGNVSTLNKKDTIFRKEIQLEAHYIGQHFRKEIGQHIKDKETCGICGKIVANGRLPLHIGLIHNKIKSILRTAKIAVEPTFFPEAAQGSSPAKNIISSPKINSSPMTRTLLTPVPFSSPKQLQIPVTAKTPQTNNSQKKNNPPETVSSPIVTPIKPKSKGSSGMEPCTPVVSISPSKAAQPIRGPGTSPGESGKETSSSSPKPTFPIQVSTPTKNLPKGGSRRSRGGSGRKTCLPKPTFPVHLTSQRSGPTRDSGLLKENWITSPVGNVTPDNRSRRDSIVSNCDTPNNAMEPVDEFLTKVGDSKPGKGSHKKALTTRNCNFDLTCEVCGKVQKTSLALETHIIAHFKADLEANVRGYITEDNKCKICGDSFKTKNWLITHLGSKHGYINKVLADQGFAVLPCHVNSSGYSASKQKQLVKIKTERKEPVEEEAGPLDDLRDELMKETGAE